MIPLGDFGSQGSASSLQFDIARFSCSDSDSSKPASKEHLRHCRVKLLHFQEGSLSIEADELFPVRQELSLPLHSELGPDLSHVFKVDVHKANSLQLLLEGKPNYIPVFPFIVTQLSKHPKGQKS